MSGGVASTKDTIDIAVRAAANNPSNPKGGCSEQIMEPKQKTIDKAVT